MNQLCFLDFWNMDYILFSMTRQVIVVGDKKCTQLISRRVLKGNGRGSFAAIAIEGVFLSFFLLEKTV